MSHTFPEKEIIFQYLYFYYYYYFDIAMAYHCSNNGITSCIAALRKPMKMMSESSKLPCEEGLPKNKTRQH